MEYIFETFKYKLILKQPFLENHIFFGQIKNILKVYNKHTVYLTINSQLQLNIINILSLHRD